jgi:hypothetical protein
MAFCTLLYSETVLGCRKAGCRTRGRQVGTNLPAEQQVRLGCAHLGRLRTCPLREPMRPKPLVYFPVTSSTCGPLPTSQAVKEHTRLTATWPGTSPDRPPRSPFLRSRLSPPPDKANRVPVRWGTRRPAPPSPGMRVPATQPILSTPGGGEETGATSRLRQNVQELQPSQPAANHAHPRHGVQGATSRPSVTLCRLSLHARAWCADTNVAPRLVARVPREGLEIGKGQERASGQATPYGPRTSACSTGHTPETGTGDACERRLHASDRHMNTMTQARAV